MGANRILVVDDDPTNFDVIETLLYNENYELHYASNSTKVIDRLEKTPYDLILLDVMMPVLDGIQLCGQIKSHQQYKWIPIIMVTALDSKQDLARCLSAGADDFITKPVNSVELRARVRSMLRIKHQHQQIHQMLNLRAEMINAIIHDLRNPITAILLASSSLQQAELSPEVRKKCDRIQTATKRLSNLVEDILILSKLEAGKLSLKYSEVNLSAMLQSIMEEMGIIAQAKSIEIVWQNHSSIRFQADVNLLRRVIENLLANAIKFSPARSQVYITTSQQEEITISVIDQGVGVPAEKKQVIWQPYESGDISATVASIGLGLSFCKLVIEAHQGKITLTDNQPQGSIFTIHLPKSP